MKKIIILLPLLLLSGCAYYQPSGVSSSNIGSQYERPIGTSEGKASRWYFFPCWALCPVGEDSLKAALADALTGTPGDTMSNVFVDRKVTFFPAPFLPLVVKSEIFINGTLVKYTTKEFPPDNDQLVDYRKLDNAVEIWKRLLGMDIAQQEKIIARLSDPAKSNLKNFLELKENAKEIKVGTKESDLFGLILQRPIYFVPPTPDPENWWGSHPAVSPK